MAVLCPPSARPAQPTPPAGWKSSANTFGATITRKGTKSLNKLGGWTIPSNYFQQRTLAEQRRLYFQFLAARWRNADSFDKGSFTTEAYSVTFTNLEGQVVTPSAYALFKHMSGAQFGNIGVVNWIGNGGYFAKPYYQFTTGDTEPAPPAITAAAWDGADTYSITCSNYNWTNCYAVQLLVTPPGIITLNAQHLITLGYLEPYNSDPWTNLNFQPTPSHFLKPWPTGTSCLFGLRVWPDDPRFYLPTPVAAELIQIGS